MYNSDNKKFNTILNTYLFDDKRKKLNIFSKNTRNKNKFNIINIIFIFIILYLVFKFINFA